jgi:hypothetical protein
MGRRFFRRQRPVSPDIGIIHSGTYAGVEKAQLDY